MWYLYTYDAVIKSYPTLETSGSLESFIFSFSFAPLFSMVHKLWFPVKNGSNVSHQGFTTAGK